MPRQKLPIPFRGVGDQSPFIQQPGDLTDPAGLLNVVPQDSPTGRQRMATRPGLVAEYDSARNTGPTQVLGSIPRASGVSGTNVVNVERGTAGGGSRYSGPFQGNGVVLDPDGSIRFPIRDTRGTGFTAPPTGTGGHDADKVCWHPYLTDIGYIATIARDTTVTTQDKVIVGVSRFSKDAEGITHQGYAVDADAPFVPPLGGSPTQQDLYVNHILAYAGYLFVAVAQYVYVFDSEDLTYLRRYAIDWCEEVQALAVVAVQGYDRLLVLGTGHPDISGPVVNDGGSAPTTQYGRDYRTCIAAYTIAYDNDADKGALGVGASILTRKLLPQGTKSGDGGYENHRTFRISEWCVGRPRGCQAFSMVAESLSDGTVYVYIARTSQGFGYDGDDANQRPDGGAPEVTVCRAVLTRGFEDGAPAYVDPEDPVRYGFSALVGGWEVAPAALRRTFLWRTYSYANDIPAISSSPHTLGNEPTFFAIALDSLRRRIAVAGRRSSLSLPTPTVYCLDADSGETIWGYDSAGTVQQNGVAFDPVNGDVWVAMARADQFELSDGRSSTKAEVLRLDGETGVYISSFDLTDAINYNGRVTSSYPIGSYGVAVNPSGDVAVAFAPFRYDV